MDFEGHFNEYNTNLKFDVSYLENVLVSGGQDKYVRIWSLDNAKLLQTYGPFNSQINNVCCVDNWKSPLEYQQVEGEEVDFELRFDSFFSPSRTSHYRPGFWIFNNKSSQFYSFN
eukprot:TRINITY_DN11444_c0_g1_i1.p1 TRINITY_DN11444_c0_g1~~TRINITY_DN11444_c0_g1_i1.p1  ORF type:complete len:115 (+),score=21.91 TRINITY_DN11444_c0_g1_i1:412-756(+)